MLTVNIGYAIFSSKIGWRPYRMGDGQQRITLRPSPAGGLSFLTGDTTAMNANCPECDAVITMDKPLKGEIVVCPDCGAELEVTDTNPLTLALAPEEEEDWGE